MSVLIIAEHDNASLKDATLAVVTAGTQLGEVHVLVAGQGCAAVADQAAKVAGVAKVLKADDAAYAHQLAENVAKLIVALAPNYSHVLAAATVNGKNFMPRAAALLDVQQISEISAVESPDTFVRPTYAGNAMTTVQSADKIKIITVRATAFDLAPAEGGSAAIENASGETLDWFWRGWFQNNWKIDQAVKSVEYANGNAAQGAIITIENREKLPMPVTVEVKEEDGKTSRMKLPVEIWMHGPVWKFHFPSTGKVVQVTIDPDQRYPDTDPSNNTWKP